MDFLAYAKVNLFLDMEGKREDGYHDIISIMQSIDWCDTISIQKNDQGAIRLSCSRPEIPTDQRNTVYKAASLFLECVGSKQGFDIHIEKRIPHEAGMAGGSADAAATLRGLNTILGDPVSMDELLKLGKKIGADVPFCIAGGTKMTEGIGEVLSEFPPIPPCYLLCAKLGEGISTPKAYASLDQLYNNFDNYKPHTEKLAALRAAFESCTLAKLSEGTYNIFEEVCQRENADIAVLKTQLTEHGACAVMMSGSGPSVFGVFERKADAERAFKAIGLSEANAKICVPVQKV